MQQEQTNNNTNKKIVVFNPDRITLARKVRGGMSQQALAVKIGINHAILNHIETEKIEFKESIAIEISKALNLPISFFTKPNPIVKVVSKFYYRKRDAFPVKEIIPLESKIDVIRQIYSELLSLVEIDFVDLPKIRVNENNSPESIARMLRVFLGLDELPLSNPIKLVEKLGIPILFVSVESSKFSGLTVQTDNNRPMIVINKNMPNDHKIFTIFHEIGHLIMHVPFSNESDFYDEIKDIDKQADEFAGAFLVPEVQARFTFSNFTYSKLNMLKEYWKVSKQCLIIRAKQLHIITDDKYTSLFVQLSRYGERRNESIEVPIDKPVLLSKIIEVNEQSLELTRKRFAEEICGLYEDDFIEWFGLQRPNLRVVL